MLKLTGTIESVLKEKGSRVWSISPRQTVYDAIETMAEKGVGALPVVSDGRLVGILSERDYARKVILKGKSSATTLVEEIMSSPVIFVTLKHAVDECMNIMTQNRVRHLPVMDQDNLLGIVSIGDLVKWALSEREETIQHLHAYINATYRT